MAALLIFQADRQLKRQRVFRDRTQDLDSLDDASLISRYRFPRHLIMELTDAIRTSIERPTSRSCAIPAHIQVMSTLRFLAKGNYQSETGDIHGISRSSVSRCLTSVCDALNERLGNILFPTDILNIRKMKEDFFQISGFPNCVGAIDGTLIPIQGMADDSIYVCRKGFHALNIQAVADAKMRFINLNCKFPGATHDAFILNASMLPELMERLPEGGWLLGDSGYPLKTWLLTPVNHPCTLSDNSYNKVHMKTRTVVERAFGVLKSRFRCLNKTGGALPFSPEKCSKVIQTCFRLHNLAITKDLPVPNADHIPLMYNNSVCLNQPIREAQRVRQRVISQF